MKTTSFILASLFSAIAWASPDFSYGFFKKVNDKYIPLSGLTDRHSPVKFSPLTDTYSDPTPFELSGTFAIALHRYTAGLAGFNDNLFGFGLPVEDFHIKYDDQGKIISHKLYKCKDNDLVITKVKKNNEICNEVDIYLLSYNISSGLPVIKGDMPKLAEEQIPKEDNLQ